MQTKLTSFTSMPARAGRKAAGGVRRCCPCSSHSHGAAPEATAVDAVVDAPAPRKSSRAGKKVVAAVVEATEEVAPARKRVRVSKTVAVAAAASVDAPADAAVETVARKVKLAKVRRSEHAVCSHVIWRCVSTVWARVNTFARWPVWGCRAAQRLAPQPWLLASASCRGTSTACAAF